MVRSGDAEPAEPDRSLGDLVALAARDMSQLVRYEVDLAKAELREDVRRAAVAGVLFGVAAFFGCLILVCLCVSYAYLLREVAHLPGGLTSAFATAAGTLAVLGVICVYVASRVIRRVTGLRKTRQTMSSDLGIIRRGGARNEQKPVAAPAGDDAAPAAVPGPR